MVFSVKQVQLLNKSKNKMNLVTATSGDTGAAAIDALKSKPYLNIFVLLFPPFFL